MYSKKKYGLCQRMLRDTSAGRAVTIELRTYNMETEECVNIITCQATHPLEWPDIARQLYWHLHFRGDYECWWTVDHTVSRQNCAPSQQDELYEIPPEDFSVYRRDGLSPTSTIGGFHIPPRRYPVYQPGPTPAESLVLCSHFTKDTYDAVKVWHWWEYQTNYLKVYDLTTGRMVEKIPMKATKPPSWESIVKYLRRHGYSSEDFFCWWRASAEDGGTLQDDPEKMQLMELPPYDLAQFAAA
jgi:hypothetical protein